MTSAHLVTSNIKKSLSSGFTLIELLIVIAVLGILAAVVLVAINPVEQLARARDAGRISSVEQLGSAMTSYMTNHSNQPPVLTSGGSWQSSLKTSQDINNVVTVPTLSQTNGLCLNGTVWVNGKTADYQNGLCYSIDNNTTPTKFYIWTNLESSNELSKISNCAIGKGIVYYSSTSQQTQIACLTTVDDDPMNETISGVNP